MQFLYINRGLRIRGEQQFVKLGKFIFTGCKHRIEIIEITDAVSVGIFAVRVQSETLLEEVIIPVTLSGLPGLL